MNPKKKDEEWEMKKKALSLAVLVVVLVAVVAVVAMGIPEGTQKKATETQEAWPSHAIAGCSSALQMSFAIYADPETGRYWECRLAPTPTRTVPTPELAPVPTPK